jgi:hypothetical protein
VIRPSQRKYNVKQIGKSKVRNSITGKTNTTKSIIGKQREKKKNRREAIAPSLAETEIGSHPCQARMIHTYMREISILTRTMRWKNWGKGQKKTRYCVTGAQAHGMPEVQHNQRHPGCRSHVISLAARGAGANDSKKSLK